MSENVKAILFDLDGVFYQGEREIKNAHTVANWVKEKQIPHLFITNTTSRPRSELVKKLAGFGIHCEQSRILTPPVAAAFWLKQNKLEKNIALFVSEKTKSEFTECELLTSPESKAEAVVLGDLGEQWDFKTLNRIFRLLMADPQPVLVALGMTRYWQAEDGMRLDVGAFVSALEYASGIQPVVLGKPATAFYQSALDILNASADQTVMIGDDIRGDIQGAQQAGLKAVLVKTGKFRDVDLASGIKPDAVLNSVLDLPGWWQQQ